MIFLGILILALTLFAFLHFIADGILAPSEQMLVRLKLLHATEEAEELLERSSGPNRQHALRVRSSYQNLINDMPRFNLWTFAAFKHKFDTDERFRKEAIARVQEFDSCGDEELIEMRRRVVRYGDKILLWNTIGWGIYIVPVAVCMAAFSKIQNGIKAIITLPPSKLDEIQRNFA
ncbi:hypothetical protein CY658_05130 [Variovorax sp. RO1]|uniref:hypothetical protein n=1 Tax=Variovorax sp. RO1 TaxID=2066034 RepID=UPI000C716FA3|nr:hypothetical protein [Variovorax sp. RO1]PLC06418.1 hypothetical protein CY658_05130 [Variovorax sp. RO1]